MTARMRNTPIFFARPVRLVAAVAVGIAITAAAPTPARAQQVVLFVNGDPITTYDIDQRTRFTQLATHKPPARQDVIDELVDEKLKLQIAKKYQLDVTQKEVDSAFSDMGHRMRMTAEQLTQSLTQNGIGVATLKSRIKADIGWGQIVRGKFQSSLQITEKDVLTTMQSRNTEDKTAVAYEYTLRPILFVVPLKSAEGVVETRKREAEALRTRFQNCDEGIPFARAIRDVVLREQIVKNSADLSQPLREMLEKTGVGNLTAPEVTQHGVEVFAICSRKEATGETPGRKKIRDEMFSTQFDAQAKRFLKELRRSAMIEEVK